MVAVEDLARGVHARALLRLLAPRHFKAGVEIVAQHARLGAAEGLLREPVNVFQELFAYLVAELCLRELFAVFVKLLVLAALADLVLQDLDLLAQDKVLLDLADAGADLALNVLLHRGHIDLAAQNFVHTLQSRQRTQLVENVLLVLIAQIELLGDEVGKIARVVRAEHGSIDFVGQLLRDLNVFGEIGIGLAEHRLGALAVARERGLLIDKLRLRLQKRQSLLRRARHAPSIITRSTWSLTRRICVTRATVPIS